MDGTISFIVDNVFFYPDFFVIPDKFENSSFYLYEELSWNFEGYTLNVYITSGKMAIFALLILRIHEHGRSFYILRSSSISFFRDLKFLSY